MIAACRCLHPETSHNYGTGKKVATRTTCNACGCKTYEEAT